MMRYFKKSFVIQEQDLMKEIQEKQKILKDKDTLHKEQLDILMLINV